MRPPSRTPWTPPARRASSATRAGRRARTGSWLAADGSATTQVCVLWPGAWFQPPMCLATWRWCALLIAPALSTGVCLSAWVPCGVISINKALYGDSHDAPHIRTTTSRYRSASHRAIARHRLALAASCQARDAPCIHRQEREVDHDHQRQQQRRAHKEGRAFRGNTGQPIGVLGTRSSACRPTAPVTERYDQSCHLPVEASSQVRLGVVAAERVVDAAPSKRNHVAATEAICRGYRDVLGRQGR